LSEQKHDKRRLIRWDTQQRGNPRKREERGEKRSEGTQGSCGEKTKTKHTHATRALGGETRSRARAFSLVPARWQGGGWGSGLFLVLVLGEYLGGGDFRGVGGWWGKQRELPKTLHMGLFSLIHHHHRPPAPSKKRPTQQKAPP
jgi:hypothetical protein